MAAFRGVITRITIGRLSSASSSLDHLQSQPNFQRGIASKIFVGGLSFYTTEQALSESFSQFGQVVEVKIISDRVSDRSKGFGFVTFASEDEAQIACREMNGKVLNGRVIYVDTAKPFASRHSDDMPIARGPPGPKLSPDLGDQD